MSATPTPDSTTAPARARAGALRIRPVVAGDRARWQPLWDGYNAFYGRAGETALAPEVTDATWARLLDAREPVHGLVAERGGRLVGLAHHLFHRTTLRLHDVCYLNDLYVDPAERGRGVGRRLVEAVYAAAAAAGSTRVYWHTQHDNVAARALYDRLAEHTGFVVYGRGT